MSIINCKLNSTYKRALRGTRFKAQLNEDSWGEAYELTDTQNKNLSCSLEPNGMTQCCGIDELYFQELANWIDRNYLDEKPEVLDELVAKAIRFQILPRDRRVIFIGFPIKTRTDTMYSKDAYAKIRKSLDRFGFVTLSRPYKNNNSGNQIVVMAGQFPK